MARHLSPTPRRRFSAPAVALVIVIVCVGLVGTGLVVWHLLESSTANGSSAQGQAREGDESSAVSSSDPSASSNSDENKTASEAKSEVARMLNAHEIRSVRLVGDSITAGFGTDGYDDIDLFGSGLKIYDDGEETFYETPTSVDCWANAFRAYAAERGVKDFVNAGINGAFMNRLANYPDAWLADGADVVFVALGTNDCGYYGPQEFRESAERGLAEAAQKSKLLVVLAPVCDLRPESMLVEPASELGNVLAQICEEQGYLFVDPRDYVTPEMFNDDGLHPTTEGSLAIWRCIQDTLGLE